MTGINNLAIALLATSLLLLLAVAALISLARTIAALQQELLTADEQLAAKEQHIALLQGNMAIANGRDEYLQRVITDYIAGLPTARASVTAYRTVMRQQDWRLN